MNPEYGGIKSQLMDCFGLCVQALKTSKPFERMEIVKRKKEFKKDPMKFIAKFSDKEKKLKDKIIKAKEQLIYIDISDKILRLIEKYCIEAFIPPNRVERVIRETAFSIAAYYEHDNVVEEDVKEAAELILPSRFREKSNVGDEIFEKCIDKVLLNE